MKAPPISQTGASFPLGETPQQQLESLLDQIAKLVQQLNQYAANPKELDKLMAQFEKISNEMQPFTFNERRKLGFFRVEMKALG